MITVKDYGNYFTIAYPGDGRVSIKKADVKKVDIKHDSETINGSNEYFAVVTIYVRDEIPITLTMPTMTNSDMKELTDIILG
jgi:hypothetical protein